jgi:hypothetical protein
LAEIKPEIIRAVKQFRALPAKARTDKMASAILRSAFKSVDWSLTSTLFDVVVEVLIAALVPEPGEIEEAEKPQVVQVEQDDSKDEMGSTFITDKQGRIITWQGPCRVGGSGDTVYRTSDDRYSMKRIVDFIITDLQTGEKTSFPSYGMLAIWMNKQYKK